MKLSKKQLAVIQTDKRQWAFSEVRKQLAGVLYRSEMQDATYQDDIADQFLSEINEKWDCSDFDESDLVEWIRDIQREVMDFQASHTSVNLRDYISANYESQRAFAVDQGVEPAQVTQWIKAEFIVVDGVLYSSRRELN